MIQAPRTTVERVRSGERLLRSVIDSLEARMCFVGDDGTIVGTNRRWDEFVTVMGWSAARAGVGADLFALVRGLPDGFARQLSEAVEAMLAGTAEQMSMKGYLPVGDGGEVVVVRLHPVRGHETARAVLSMVDITEATHSQNELRRQAQLLADELSSDRALLSGVLGSIPHLVYWKDSGLRYAGVNQAFLSRRGLADQESVIGRTETELDVSDDLSSALAVIETQVLDTGRSIENQRVWLTPSDRAPSSLMLSVLPQLDEDGTVCGVIGVAADVTEIGVLEQQLAQASRLESIGRLAAGIAHEINTPIQYVSHNTRFLVDSFAAVMTAVRTIDALAVGPDPVAVRLREVLADVDLEFLAEEVPGALTQSLEGLDRVAEIVTAMKDFSHPGHGESAADLNRAVESTVQVSRNEWRYVATLDLDLDPDVGLVRCHEGELKQVLLNIVVNAAQAIAGDPARVSSHVLGCIRIRTERVAGGVRITLTDDGPGMDESVRPRIFDPFFTTKPVGQGTGQGLSMAYAVIQKHGGTLGVTSTVGLGSTFTIDLPDAPAGALGPPVEPPARPGSKIGTGTLPG